MTTTSGLLRVASGISYSMHKKMGFTAWSRELAVGFFWTRKLFLSGLRVKGDKVRTVKLKL
jgi:hypothetical protein